MFAPLICLSFLFQFCIYDAAPAPSLTDYLNPTESITDGEFLVSAGNNFALGFFSPGNSSYRYVGIWYYKIPKTTAVWVANRDNGINDSSGVISFAQDGNLVISSLSNQRQPLWSTNVSLNSDSTFLRLLDSGNLVLYSHNAARDTTRVLWQSFDHPTHILLAGMKLGLNRKTGLNSVLTSWKSQDDPSRGMYSFGFYSGFDSRGRSTEQFLYNGSVPVWRTGPWNGQRFSGTSEMSQNNYLFNYKLVDNSDELYIVYNIYNSSFSSPFVLDYSGTMERLMWIERNRGWRTYYSTPKDNCDYYGHCGAYGSCRIADNALECSCLPGFEPKSPMDWYLRDWSDGCVRKRSLGCGNGDGFLTLLGVKLPDSSMAALVDKSLSVKECEQRCSKNCSCTAYAPADKTGGGSGCIAWFGELMDIRYFNEDGDNLYLRVDAVEIAAAHARKHKGFLHDKRNVIILTVSLVVTSLLLFAAFMIMHHLLKRRNGAAERSYGDLTGIIELQDDQTNPDIPFIELNVVAAITDDFSPSNLLGEGGFGAVYKGRLFNGKEVAVKRLSKNSGQGMEEFKNEVLLISKLQHRNLVRLLASCVHEEEKILMYEYMPNNSLDSFIFDKAKSAMLDWKKRFEIIDGIARGVLYLHHDSRLRIIHRDLKASNVLLDDEMNPKISDFGMARIFGVHQVQANTIRVVGTFGYMSPEYAMHGIFSTKSDVFSFGVLLLEILTGKKNNVYFHEDPSTNLIEHVWELWNEGRALDLVDSSMNGSYPIYKVSRCIQVGLLCVQESASDRPNMSSVIFMLGSETEIPTPNRPGFIMKRTLEGLDSSSTYTGPCSINKMTTTMVEPR